MLLLLMMIWYYYNFLHLFNWQSTIELTAVTPRYASHKGKQQPEICTYQTGSWLTLEKPASSVPNEEVLWG